MEIVVYSLSMGQFVTIAWFESFYYYYLVFSNMLIGLCRMADEFYPIESDSGCTHTASTGIVIAVCGLALCSPHRLCIPSTMRSLFSVIACHQSATFTVSIFLLFYTTITNYDSYYFIVNLTDIYSLLLESEYEHLPTLGSLFLFIHVHVTHSFLL